MHQLVTIFFSFIIHYNVDFFISLFTFQRSRAAILTGRYPYKLGVQRQISIDENRCLPLNETLLPERLKSLGYKTHAIGK